MNNPNQNMMGMMQVPDLPSPQELWKDEPTKYRQWMIVFFVGLISIFALLTVTLIMQIVYMDRIVDYIYGELIKDSSEVSRASIEKNFIIKSLVFAGVEILFVGIGVYYFIVSLLKSYKEKSFEHISPWSTTIVGAGALFNFINLIWSWMGGTFSAQFNYPGNVGIIQFIADILFILIYIFASYKVSRTRRIFVMSSRVQQLKQDPSYQAMINQLQGTSQTNGVQNGMFGPFGPMIQPSKDEQVIETNNDINFVEKTKLESLTLKELKSVAKELSISGHSEMDRNELIKTILRVKSTKNSDASPIEKMTNHQKYQSDLEAMTIAQLRSVASELSISGYENMSKKELIENILRVTNN